MRKIVVDIYGADLGAEPIIKGVGRAIKDIRGFNAVFVGESETVSSILNKMSVDENRYEIIHTDKFISNNDLPTAVFGGNDEASMVMGYDRLKRDEDCIAMLSPGNTGALLVGSICRLGLVDGIKFPALSTALPSLKGNLVCLVDCGANVDCTANDLARYAILGDAFMKSMCKTQNPRVGLLSVGREQHKGNTLTKEAYKLIEALPLNFIGNVEGNDLVTGYADVIVSDGFAGNVLLKTAEAAGKAAMSIVDSYSTFDNAELIREIKEHMFRLFDFNSQGGATFLGPKKTVVKMHGCATELTAYACIEQILKLEDGGFTQMMREIKLV